MAILTLAAKDFRLLRRDFRSAVILLVMPLVFVGVLSVAVGEGFGQKPDDRLRVSVVNLDEGIPLKANEFPHKRWSEVVLDDLAGAADIRIEVVDSREEAEQLIRDGKRSAILVFEPDFSAKIQRCSFLTKAEPPPLNPLYRDGISPAEVSLSIRKDPTQAAAASIIEQVAQVTLFRVVIPWMIGKAFERVGDAEFMQLIEGKLKEIPSISGKVLHELDPVLAVLIDRMFKDEQFRKMLQKKFGLLAPTIQGQMPKFQELLTEVFKDEVMLERMGKNIPFGSIMRPSVQETIGPKVQEGISDTFSNYNFRAKTWAGLTKSLPNDTPAGTFTKFEDESGLPKRGALRFQILVPSYTVTFAFFLVLTVGGLFVAERRQGTLVRLRAAPLKKSDLLLGKFLPALGVSLLQGVFLMVAGKLIFGLSWGTQPLLLLLVVATTAFAATGLAMLVASVAKTETQVAVYGTLLVLVLAGIGGSMMPRDLMPESMRQASHITPHAWALDAYQQLLLNPEPNALIVLGACGALVAFGTAFMAAAWWLIRLE